MRNRYLPVTDDESGCMPALLGPSFSVQRSKELGLSAREAIKPHLAVAKERHAVRGRPACLPFNCFLAL